MKILESFIASPHAGAIGWTLLHSLWEGALISAVFAAILLATRSPRIRYVAGCVAMLAIVAAFGVTLFRLLPEPAANFPRFRAVVPFVPVTNAARQADNARTWLSALAILAPWLAPFWIFGVLLLSLQRVMSFFAVRKLRTRGVCFASEEWRAHLARMAAQLRISRPVHLLESCFAEIPMVLGHLRPVILIPIGLLANLPAEQVETILLHELAHIRRRDYLVNVFPRLIESLLFYHPAVWWISKIIRAERENCCDDIVVSVTRHAHEYAQALAALERSRLPRHQAAIAATGGTLVRRIRRLLYPKAPAGIAAPIAAAAIFLLTAAISLAAWPPKTAQQTPAFDRTRTQPALAHSQQASAVPQIGSQSQGAPQLKPLSRAPINIKATEDSRMIYETIASLAGLNIEFDPSFTSRRISVSLAGVSLGQALDAVSSLSGNQWVAVAPDRFVVAAAGVQHTGADTDGSGQIPASQPTTFVAQGKVQVVSTNPYSKWLNEDVVYIITDEERDTFLHLKTDEERRQFITAFWERRNPHPGSADNKFKDEHYRRIAYANQHFGTPSGKPGWQTDRGHIYIVYGPPDAQSESSASQNGNEFATEIWRYNHIEGVGDNLSFMFVNRGGSGDFVLVPSPSNSQIAPKPGASNTGTEPDWNAEHGITILSATDGVNFQPYINDMLKSVQAHWYSTMPREAIQGKAVGQVSVIFNIQPDGRLGESHVASGSGVRSLDDAALGAVRGSSPLKPLPNEFHGPYLRLKLTFAYNQALHG